MISSLNRIRAALPCSLACLVLGCCAAITAVFAAAHSGSAQNSPAEPLALLLINGAIYTGDPARLRAEAVAIAGERIVDLAGRLHPRVHRGLSLR